MSQEPVLKQAEKPARFTVQDCTFQQGIRAVMQADGYDGWDSYRPVLEETLPFNSRETRHRYVSSIRKWAFEDGVPTSLAARVWQAYRDEGLLAQVLRERYLAAYPVLGRFVTHFLAHIPPGESVTRQLLEDFLKTERVSYVVKSARRLRTTMRDLGFLRMQGPKKVPLVNATTLPGTAFLILLHHHFAPQPTTVEVRQVLAHPFWRYLGGRDEAEVRAALSLAAARDLITRYATVDHLEQVTTRFSLDELLKRQARL